MGVCSPRENRVVRLSKVTSYIGHFGLFKVDFDTQAGPSL